MGFCFVSQSHYPSFESFVRNAMSSTVPNPCRLQPSVSTISHSHFGITGTWRPPPLNCPVASHMGVLMTRAQFCHLTIPQPTHQSDKTILSFHAPLLHIMVSPQMCQKFALHIAEYPITMKKKEVSTVQFNELDYRPMYTLSLR